MRISNNYLFVPSIRVRVDLCFGIENFTSLYRCRNESRCSPCGMRRSHHLIAKIGTSAEPWRPATVLLKLIGENSGCVVLARLAVQHGLRKGVKDDLPEYDSDRPRDRPWGKRKLKRDE